MYNLKNLNNAKKGIGLIEGLLGLLLMISVILIGVSLWGAAEFRLDRAKLTSQVSDINSGSSSWKGQRSNYTGLSMAVLCEDGRRAIQETTCGGWGGNGTNTNAFGGNFVLAPATNVSQKSLQITGLPTERIKEIADNLAPLTADGCLSADDCDTLAIVGSTITLTL